MRSHYLDAFSYAFRKIQPRLKPEDLLQLALCELARQRSPGAKPVVGKCSVEVNVEMLYADIMCDTIDLYWVDEPDKSEEDGRSVELLTEYDHSADLTPQLVQLTGIIQQILEGR